MNRLFFLKDGHKALGNLYITMNYINDDNLTVQKLEVK